MEKTCIDCKMLKPLGDYFKNTSSKDGHLGTCKACKARQQRERRKAGTNPKRYLKEAERRRNDHLQTNYGIDSAEYLRMYAEQKGVCAICKQTEAQEGRALCVDHSHITGDVRGLLCSNCNRGIGLLQDSPELIRNAFHYLTGVL